MSTTRKRPRSYASLAAYFEQSGETQKALAARLKLPQSSLSRIAAGQRIPRPRLALRLIRACHLPVDCFVLAYLAPRRRPAKRKKAA
jgi:transcriptional regulator with XRE-family HTH domain